MLSFRCSECWWILTLLRAASYHICTEIRAVIWTTLVCSVGHHHANPTLICEPLSRTPHGLSNTPACRAVAKIPRGQERVAHNINAFGTSDRWCTIPLYHPPQHNCKLTQPGLSDNMPSLTKVQELHCHLLISGSTGAKLPPRVFALFPPVLCPSLLPLPSQNIPSAPISAKGGEQNSLSKGRVVNSVRMIGWSRPGSS